MKYFLILLFFLPGLVSRAQKITIDNQSTQSDSTLQLFSNYLVSKNGLFSTHQTVLTVEDYHLGLHPLRLEFVGYQMGNSIFPHFNSSVYFTISDSTSGKSYHGLVLEKQVFVNQIEYFHFSATTYFDRTIENLFGEVLKKHYPKCTLEGNIWVKNEAGEYIGELKLEYKTLERQGCIVTETYSTIEPDDYTVLGKSQNIEAVVVFYRKASEDFYRKGYYNGDQFEMYDLNNELVHKGVISRYLDGFYDMDQDGK